MVTKMEGSPVSDISFRDANFRDAKGRLFPIIGLKKPGDHVMANFGQLPFQFNIDEYMEVCLGHSQGPHIP